MGLRVVVNPTVEPLSLSEAKLHARVDGTDEDALFLLWISAARAHGESITRRAFCPQTLELSLPSFPLNGEPIELPRPPFGAVSSIKYVNAEGTSVTMEATDYVVHAEDDSVPAKVSPVFGSVWPVTNGDSGSVIIRYTAGPELDSETGLPLLNTMLKAWMLIRVTSLYYKREPFVAGTSRDTLVQLPRDFSDGLLDPFVIPEVV